MNLNFTIECFFVAMIALMLCALLFFETIPMIRARKDCDNISKRKQLIFVYIIITISFLCALFLAVIGIILR